MNGLRGFLTSLIILLIASSFSPANADMIPVSNPSFDDAADGSTYTYDFTPWQKTSGYIGNGYYSGYPAGDGWYVVQQNSQSYSASISQPLTETFQQDARYSFTIDVGNFSTKSGNTAWTIFIYDATLCPDTTAAVPVPLASNGGNIPDSQGIWNSKTVSYTATAAQAGHNIGIGFFGDYYTLFDHAELESSAVATARSGRWSFQSQYISGSTVADQTANGYDGTINGAVNLNQNPEALVLDGTSNYVTLPTGPLPTREITLKGWVRADSTIEWAGIVNYIQDNGAVEHGWILGQSGGSFMFGLSTGALTYLTADTPFQTEQWYFVAGTYDGSEMKIYINGRLAGTSTARSGDISYQASEFRIGSYIDSNEQYLWNGMISEVAVYDSVHTPSQIQAEFDSRKESFGYYDMIEPTAGPYVHFYNADEVTVYWSTPTAVPSMIEYGTDSSLGQTIADSTPKTEHALTIPNVTPETEYSYRFITQDVPSGTYTFYSAFDPGPGPVPAVANPYPVDELTDVYAQAAEYIISTSGIDKGICIDYGCGTGRLAYEIAKRSNLKIIAFDDDPQNIAQAREYLDNAGVYGSRISVIEITMPNLKCRDYSANLVVSDEMIAQGTCPGTSAEIFRVLKPEGGAAILGRPDTTSALNKATLEAWLTGQTYALDETQGLWTTMTRAQLDGAGKWTHYYGDTANTANSGDTRITNSLKALWYGNPGPRYIVDRHNRPMSSLYNKGIIITPGVHRVMAYDAYNGTRYWDMSIPNSARVAMPKDTGWIAMADDNVYVVNNSNCVALDMKTGQPVKFLDVPQLTAGQKSDWGFLAIDGDNIIGSNQKKGASLIGPTRAHVYQSYFDNIPQSTGEYLFSMDRASGDLNWTYKKDGGSAILKPTIVITGDHVYFIESRNPTAINDADGRIPASTLFSGSNEYIIKLNKSTGDVLLEMPVTLPYQHVAYLSYAADKDLIIATGTWNNGGYQYDHNAYNASDLSFAWNVTYFKGGAGADHGEQDQHPVIVGDMIYSKYYKVDLNNASLSSSGLATGGCGAVSGCETHLFARNSNPCMYELPSVGANRLTGETRIGCWINMIPAGGLVIAPESGSGCTCDFQLQTSMTFMPN